MTTKKAPSTRTPHRLIPVAPQELVRFWHPRDGGLHTGHLFAMQGDFRHIRPINKTRKVVVPSADVQSIKEEATPCPK